MKNVWKVFLIAMCLVLASCAQMDYAVTVKNSGKSRIWVDPFQIYESDTGKDNSATVVVGNLPPSKKSSILHFSQTPYKEVELSWSVEETGKKNAKKVSLEIPKAFWVELIHHEIIIDLNPDNEMIKVLYSGYSTKEDKDYWIDSDGNITKN